jgi:hypothetical protein
MPTVQALKEKAAAIKKKIAEKAGKIEAPKARTMRKRLKRTQRAARALETRAKHFAAKSKKKEKAAEG